MPQEWMSAAASAVVSLIALGLIGYLWKRIEKKSEDCEDLIRRALYDEAGVSRYVHRGDCTAQHVKLRAEVMEMLEDIRECIRRGEEKRDRAREVIEQRDMQLREFMGQVREFMRTNQRGSP